VDAKDDGASGGPANVNAPLAFQSLETPLRDGSMQGLIPHAGGLLHAINALQELPHPIFLSGALEPGRLFHEHTFVRRQNAVEKGCLDVILLEVPVEGRSEVRDGAERFKAGGRGSGFVVVDPILLRITFRDIADLVADDFTRVVPFPFAD